MARCAPSSRCSATTSALAWPRRSTPALRRRATASLAARRLLVADVLGVLAEGVELTIFDDGRRGATVDGSEPIAVSVSTSGDAGLVAVSASCIVGVDVDDFGEHARPRPSLSASRRPMSTL